MKLKFIINHFSIVNRTVEHFQENIKLESKIWCFFNLITFNPILEIHYAQLFFNKQRSHILMKKLFYIRHFPLKKNY